jgi:hypothetical protein
MKNKYEPVPMPDLKIAIDEPDELITANLDDEEKDNTEYVSRNKLLQEKYDEYFKSNIIWTGTVSIVSESKNKNEVDRREVQLENNMNIIDDSYDSGHLTTNPNDPYMGYQSSIPDLLNNSYWKDENLTANDIKGMIVKEICKATPEMVKNQKYSRAMMNASRSNSSKLTPKSSKHSSTKQTTYDNPKLSSKSTTNLKRLAFAKRRKTVKFDNKPAFGK